MFEYMRRVVLLAVAAMGPCFIGCAPQEESSSQTELTIEIVPSGREDDEEELSRPHDAKLQKGVRVFVTFPYTVEDGTPVAAILDDTHHGGGDTVRIHPGRPKEYGLYGTRMSHRLVVWASGRTMWRVGPVWYHVGKVPPARVNDILSSIRVEDYNSVANMSYSYAGYACGHQSYSVMFASKGNGENVILHSPFHYYLANSPYGNDLYAYWDESGRWDLFPTVHYSDSAHLPARKKYTWSEFTNAVPRRFLAYLDTCNSLESKLLPLISEAKHSTMLDPRKHQHRITLISQVYEYRPGTPPKWIPVDGKSLWPAPGSLYYESWQDQEDEDSVNDGESRNEDASSE
ncbi:MAG: hypothetical protein GXY83_10870 [Rhodopirellula sp.]|nr:hypothetical protein [Rhodopirellula sp.]